MNSAGAVAKPWGLVMVGGASRRMGTDKARLVRADGRTWLDHAVDLVADVCDSVWVSARAGQVVSPPAGVGVIRDVYQDIGPAAGLLSAWDRFPEQAWLVLATDMPWVSSDLLRRLLGSRNPAVGATAFRHAEGVAEPLCTLWEPAARGVLQRNVGAGKTGLRSVLKDLEVNWLGVDDPRQLASVNTPAQRKCLTP